MKRMAFFLITLTLLGVTTVPAQATTTFLGGPLTDVGPHPLALVGDEGMALFGEATVDGIGTAQTSMLIDFFGHIQEGDPVFLDTLLLDFSVDDPSLGFIEFGFDMATLNHTAVPGALLGAGVLTADVISVDTDMIGLDLDGFIGQVLVLNYVGLDIMPGAGDFGDAGKVTFGEYASANFALAAVPEPSTFALGILGVALVGLFVGLRNRK